MKKLLLFIALFAGLISLQAQDNPFSEYGYQPKIATLSNGQFIESFDNDTIVQIGSVLFNTKSKQIIAFVEYDTLYSEATLEPDIVSRWMSPDPLASEFPSRSPYEAFASNPIYFLDPDGQAVIPVNAKSRSAFINILYNQFNSDVGHALASSFNKITDTRDISQAMSQKQFDKILKKSDLNAGQRAQAEDLYRAITSEKENFLDIRTIDNGASRQFATGEGDYYNVDGMSATINGLTAKTPSKLKEHKLTSRTITDLNTNGVSTSFSTAKDEATGQEKRISLTISMPLEDGGRITNADEQNIIQGVIMGNDNTGEK